MADKITDGDIITADGSFEVRMKSQVNFTVNWVAGSGTVALYQAGQTAQALTASASYTTNFKGITTLGDIDVVVSGTSGAQIQFFIKPVYSTP